MMATQAAQTPTEAYRRSRNDIASMLDWLQMSLDAHAGRAEAEPANWALAGDLAEVRKRIMEVLTFVSGRTEADIEEALAELREEAGAARDQPSSTRRCQ
jgi:hypothetical protein